MPYHAGDVCGEGYGVRGVEGCGRKSRCCDGDGCGSFGGVEVPLIDGGIVGVFVAGQTYTQTLHRAKRLRSFEGICA